MYHALHAILLDPVVAALLWLIADDLCRLRDHFFGD